jgi:hypothetical protein
MLGAEQSAADTCAILLSLTRNIGYRNSKFASTKGKPKMPETKVSKREEYVAKMNVQLDDINEQIDKLEDKSKGTRAVLAKKYKQEMAELRAKSDRAVAKRDELKKTGEIRGVIWLTRRIKSIVRLFGLSKKEKIESDKKKYSLIFSELKEKLIALSAVEQEDVLAKFFKINKDFDSEYGGDQSFLKNSLELKLNAANNLVRKFVESSKNQQPNDVMAYIICSTLKHAYIIEHKSLVQEIMMTCLTTLSVAKEKLGKPMKFDDENIDF